MGTWSSGSSKPMVGWTSLSAILMLAGSWFTPSQRFTKFVKKTNMMDPKPAARGTSDCMTVTVRCCPIDRSSTHSSERLVRWKAFGADSLGAHQKVVVTILLRHIWHMHFIAFHCIVPSEIADMSRFAEGVRIDPDVFGALVESLERRIDVECFARPFPTGKASGGTG